MIKKNLRKYHGNFGILGPPKWAFLGMQTLLPRQMKSENDGLVQDASDFMWFVMIGAWEDGPIWQFCGLTSSLLGELWVHQNGLPMCQFYSFNSQEFENHCHFTQILQFCTQNCLWIQTKFFSHKIFGWDKNSSNWLLCTV